ncbi:hypothetical protein J1605_017005 [Eschrichtius robustus]|uniref:Uncharacterized protein n=1 Tax=Eschrichtius robustus TaxID=9764 RepID=A0AB34I323_ESCRO|nr:hypothetical protein J1605_017005 [Eschrichtius robustus]
MGPHRPRARGHGSLRTPHPRFPPQRGEDRGAHTQRLLKAPREALDGIEDFDSRNLAMPPNPSLAHHPGLPAHLYAHSLIDDCLPQPGRLSDNLAFGFLMEDNSPQHSDAALTTQVPSFGEAVNQRPAARAGGAPSAGSARPRPDRAHLPGTPGGRPVSLPPSSTGDARAQPAAGSPPRPGAAGLALGESCAGRRGTEGLGATGLYIASASGQVATEGDRRPGVEMLAGSRTARALQAASRSNDVAQTGCIFPRRATQHPRTFSRMHLCPLSPLVFQRGRSGPAQRAASPSHPPSVKGSRRVAEPAADRRASGFQVRGS